MFHSQTKRSVKGRAVRVRAIDIRELLPEIKINEMKMKVLFKVLCRQISSDGATEIKSGQNGSSLKATNKRKALKVK